MTIPFNFDSVTHSPEVAREAKDSGMGRATIPTERHQLLEIARSVAHSYARTHGEVSADSVRRFFIETGLDYTRLGPAAGSIFRPKSKWEFVRYESSGYVSRHGNRNGIWRIRRGL